MNCAEHTYFARIARQAGRRADGSRLPAQSDAIAVAVTAKVPICVAEDVIDEANEEQ